MQLIIRRILRYILGISLLLTWRFVLADSSSLSDVAFGSDQVKNYTDLSISYLSQLFGTVGNVLHGTSGQILGQLFYVFNTGILIAAGIWLCYTVLTVLLKSSQEGSFSGQNRNAAVIFLKIALGIAFLVPSPSTGYNVLQAIVAKVIVAGVDLADSMWNKALDYMNDGGTIFSLTPMTADNTDIFQNPQNDTQTALKAMRTILSNEVCMYQANSQRATPANIIIDNKHHQIQFPGPHDNASATSLSNPECGYVSWNIGGFCTDTNSNSKEENAKKCSTYQQAIYQTVTDLWQTGITYAYYYPVTDDDNSSSTNISKDELDSQAKTAIVNAFIDYINLAIPATRIDYVSSDQNKNDFYEKTAREGGWITAGQYYWKLVKYNDDITGDDNHTQLTKMSIPASEDQLSDGNDLNDKSKYKITIVGPSKFLLANGTNYRTANQAVIGLPIDGDNGMYATLQIELNSLVPQMTDDTFGVKKNSFPSSFPTTASGAKKLGQALLGIMVDPMGEMYHTFTALLDTNKNPLRWAQNVGTHMLKAAGSYVTFLTIALPVLGFFGGITAGGGGFIIPIITWSGSTLASGLSSIIKMLLLPVIFISVIGGVTLAFYLPLLPFFIYSFNVVTYFIISIEGFTAAPIVALGLTHPEGHDFLGRAEQSLILLLNLFIRPPLLVFGLIAALVLSYVTMEFVQHGTASMFYTIGLHNFGKGFSALSLWKAMFTSGYSFLGPLIFIILVTMYIFFIYQVIVKAFSIIYLLPNRILRWIGGFEQQDDTAMLAEQQKGIAVQGGAQGGKMAMDNVTKSENMFKKGKK